MRVLRNLAHGLQAARTHILAGLATTFKNGRPLNIGLELALRLFLREAYVLPELWSLAT